MIILSTIFEHYLIYFELPKYIDIVHPLFMSNEVGQWVMDFGQLKEKIARGTIPIFRCASTTVNVCC